MIIDTHAHYDHRNYNDDRDELLASLPANGIELVINVGSSMQSSRASVKLAGLYTHVYASVGVHPHDAKTLDEAKFEELKKLCKEPKVVAYGEIGLDFFHNFSPPDVQREWFKRQITLAHELNLPVIIHSRDAAEEVFDVRTDLSINHWLIIAALAVSQLAVGEVIKIIREKSRKR